MPARAHQKAVVEEGEEAVVGVEVGVQVVGDQGSGGGGTVGGSSSGGSAATTGGSGGAAAPTSGSASGGTRQTTTTTRTRGRIIRTSTIRGRGGVILSSSRQAPVVPEELIVQAQSVLQGR